MIASAMTERLTRKVAYMHEEVRVLKESLATATGKKRIAFSAEQRRRLALKRKRPHCKTAGRLLPKQAIVDFHIQHPLEGYRRAAFMMLDQNIVAASPTSVYRVLSAKGLLDRWNGKPSKKALALSNR